MSWRLPRCGASGASPCSPAGSLGAEPRSRCPDVRVSLVAALASLLGVVTPVAAPASLVLGALSLLPAGPTLAQATTEERVIFQGTLTVGDASGGKGWIAVNAAPAGSILIQTGTGSLPTRQFGYLGVGYAITVLVIDGSERVELAFLGSGRPTTRLKSEGILYIGTHKLNFSDSITTSFDNRKETNSGISWNKPSGATSWPSFSTGSTYTIKVAVPVLKNPVPTKVTLNLQENNGQQVAVGTYSSYQQEEKYREYYRTGLQFRVKSTAAWPVRATESNKPTSVTARDLPPLEDGKILRTEFSNLAAGTTYQFRAHLVEKFATTDRVVAASSQVQEVTLPPAAPTGLSVAAGNEELRLTWTAPTGATDYDVHYTSADAATVANDAAASGNDESAAWVDAVSTGATSATQGRPRATILLLTNNVAYRVRVRAKNSGGNSAWASGTGTPKSNDATLSALTATSSTSASGSFTSLNIGAFASGATSYTAAVENTVTHVKLRPTVNESNATVKVGKGSSLTTVSSGSASSAIALAVGANALKVEVTAHDGTTKKTYTVTVTRAKSNDATLSGLTATGSTSATGSFTSLSIGTFASGTTSYAATVESTVTHVKLRPTVNHSGATVKVGKGSSLTTVTSGSASGAIALNSQGSTAITVEVTAEDGVTQKTYTVTMDRFSHQLGGLRVAVPGREYRDPSGPTYSQPEVRVPNFRRDTFGYNIEVPYDATELIVTAKWPGSNAIVSITSNGGGTIITRKKNFRTKDGTETVGLAASGQTTIVIKVDNSGSDACSETTCSDYTLRVTKTAVAKASIATTSAWGGEVWEGEGTIRVTATLSYALHHDVRVPLDIGGYCGEASWCHNKSVFVPRGQTVGTLDLKPPRATTSKGDQVLTINLAPASSFPAGIARATAQKDYRNTITVRNLDFDVELRSGKTELAEGEETTVTLDLGHQSTRGTDEVRFLVTVEGMGTGDNPAKPSRSVTNPSADGGDFSLWAEGRTVAAGNNVQGVRYPGRARPRVSNGKLMLAVPFNKGDQTKTLKLKIGNDAVVELDETFKLKVAVQFGSEEKTAELEFTITDNDRSRDVPEYNEDGELVDGGAKVYVLDPVKEWGQNYASCLAVVRLVSNAKGGVRLEQAVTIPVSVNGQKRSLTIGAGKTANWIENANKDVTVEVLRDELPEDGLVSREDPRTALTEVTAAYYSLDGQRVYVYNPYEEADVTRRYAYENGCVASPTVPEDEEGKRKYGPSSGTDGETLLVGFGQIAQTLPEVSIERVGSSPISEGQMASFRLTADPAPAAGESISVAVTVTDSGEFVSSGQPNPRMVTIGEDGTADFSVATQDDDMDEANGSITVTVAAGTGYTVSDNTAEAEVEVEIRDNDAPAVAPPTEEKRSWQIRFGRSVSQQVVDALQQRFSTTSTSPSGLQLTLAGETLTSDTPLEENHVLLSRLLGFESVSGQELAQGSSFSFSPDGDGPRLSFWGKGAFSSFNGIEESITLTGDVTTALVAAEWNTQRWQAGAALSHSWGDGSYQGEGDGADGRISSSLTGIFPYGRYALTPRLGVWATAGYGWGSLSLNPDGDGPEYNPNTTMALGAVGMDGLLLDGGREGITLTTTADALFLKTSSEAVEGLASSEGNITRLRLGLEASRAFPLANGASLSPSLEVGLRQDNGDAETGFGMDLGAGLSWNDPEQGITAAVKGRTLLSHGAEDFQDQGLALSFSWRPTPSNRGASLSLSHAVGLPAEGGMAALLNPTAIEVLDEPHSSGERFEARLAYGFPFYNNRLTLSPAVATALSNSSRTYGLLWSLSPYDEHLMEEPWQLSLEGERQETFSSSPTVDHSLKLRFALPL